MHFTPKETDIYKIHQSGDLANLSGLAASALDRLPSLLQLRDAMYSQTFRDWVSEVSGAGPLSGIKTDMAVNVNVPGCHLLCHDDVIGSRRVSYILYLTDPDEPWQASWGGALRLYPTKVEEEAGKQVKVPQPQWTKSIPPAWNQLSFFAVQPGESFHDVEEVFAPQSVKGKEPVGGRVRMAISGWFHIPQEGEVGFEEGLEAKLAERSSLQQLQGKDDRYDLPKPMWRDAIGGETSGPDEEDDMLNEQDLEFLLQFMTPHYLTPDTVEELTGLFEVESSVQLANILSKGFSKRLKAEILEADKSRDVASTGWNVAGPPYKHRYLFKQHSVSQTANAHSTPLLTQLLNEFLPSLAFRKWLSTVTGLDLGEADVLARRFRRTLDYTLATGYEGDDPQIEYCLNLTPTAGWGGDDGGDEDSAPQPEADEDKVPGGYELYMAGDDDDEDGSDDGVDISQNASATGGGNRRIVKGRKSADPAVYNAGNGNQDEDDDGILFSNPASWNILSIVLRDKGVMKFVKYVNHFAPGDRWDIAGTVRVLDQDDGEDSEEEGDEIEP